uniref:Uncharacterized protein n=1 Tax=Hyaloperonospora arabidopsidis (strain Emoy2) TaxID=559515 RepID=M4BTK7_HYAAE
MTMPTIMQLSATDGRRKFCHVSRDLDKDAQPVLDRQQSPESFVASAKLSLVVVFSRGKCVAESTTRHQIIERERLLGLSRPATQHRVLCFCTRYRSPATWEGNNSITGELFVSVDNACHELDDMTVPEGYLTLIERQQRVGTSMGSEVKRVNLRCSWNAVHNRRLINMVIL